MVLPKLLEIILENKDRIAQEYLFDCLLSAFEGSYHVETLQTLLDATKKLNKRVNINEKEKEHYYTMGSKITK